ncbi:MAG: hypothetical protein MZV63_58635 [Marinilabiliales bacterium]|nr:hypothetical protein [Marinilabiliales bacterium]
MAASWVGVKGHSNGPGAKSQGPAAPPQEGSLRASLCYNTARARGGERDRKEVRP